MHKNIPNGHQMEGLLMNEEYYFCFCNSSHTKWLNLFKKNYRHCFISIRYADIFVVLEDSFEGFIPNLMTKEDFFRFTKLNSCSIITRKGNKCAKKRFGIWYWAPTCVNFVKTVANLRTRAQTPYQLYKYLLKNGGKLWVDTQDKSQDSKPLRNRRKRQLSNKQS